MRRLRWHHLVLALALAIHALALAAYFVPVLTGPDENGNQVAARLLAEHGRLYQEPVDELEFVGRMWVTRDAERYYPKYPPFFALLAALAMRLLGDLGSLSVAPLLAWSCGPAIYLLCRRLGLSGGVSVLGTFVWITLPLHNTFAIRQLSHPVSLALLLWSYVAFFAADRRPVKGRGGLLLLASGLLLGAAIGTRYTDILFVLPGLVWLLRPSTQGSTRRRIAWWSIGWLVPCAFLALYHWRAFGAPWTTGYALTGEQSAFSLRYLLANLRLYAAEAPVLLIGPITVLAAIGWLLALRRDRSRAWFYVAWILPLLTISPAYYWAPEHHAVSYVRFLLPLAIPAVVLAMSAVDHLTDLARATPRERLAVLATIVVLQGAWGISGSLVELETVHAYHQQLARQNDAVLSNVEPESVVIGELGLLESLDYYRRNSLYWVGLFDREGLTHTLQRSVEDTPDSLQADRARALWNRLLDVDPATHRDRMVTVLREHLAAGRSLYLAGSPELPRRFTKLGRGIFTVERLFVIDAKPSAEVLFTPTASVSRAAPGQPLMDPPFAIFRIRVAPEGES